MRARDVVGKRIARVVQGRVWNESVGGKFSYDVRCLVFEDGSKLALSGIPINWDYGVEGIFVPAPKEEEE